MKRWAVVFPAFGLAAALFFPGCADMQLVNRAPGVARVEKQLVLPGGGILVGWETDGVLFRGSSFRLEAGGRVIYFDPKDLLDPVPADLILITHPHEDHYSPADIARVAKAGTVFVCPASMSVDLPGLAIVRMRPGEAATAAGFAVRAVPAYNFVHQSGNGWLGYIVDVGGTRVYHAGDTDFIPEMRALAGAVDVALVPIGMGFLAMTPEVAAAAVDAIKPALAVPMHYQIAQGKAERFKAAVAPGIEVAPFEDWPPR